MKITGQLILGKWLMGHQGCTVWMNVQAITDEVQNGTFKLALQWEGITGTPAIRIFAAVETNGGTLYLTDTNVATMQTNMPFGTNSAEFLFSTADQWNFWQQALQTYQLQKTQ